MTSSKFPEFISLDHGSGGKKTDQIIDFIASFLEYRNPDLGIGVDARDDSAILKLGNGINIVTTMDGHTVDPLFFPGGDIGKLSMCGTINDIAVMGAKPLALTVSIIMEEGFKSDNLARIIKSMNKISVAEKVPIVAGDTKVLPKGTIDNIIIATSAVGIVKDEEIALDSALEANDVLILSGPIGNHGIALMSVREGLEFETDLKSDIACLLQPIRAIIDSGIRPHTMKDPTRGGIASAFNDLAESSGVIIDLIEDKIPILEPVRAASEMLGLDVYTIANEGCIIIAVNEKEADMVLEILKNFSSTKSASIVGRVTEKTEKGKVTLTTVTGGKRILRKPLGKLIPRIC